MSKGDLAMSEATSPDMILGEVRGQLYEVIHSVNNLSQNVMTLAREVSGLASMATELAGLKLKVDSLEKTCADISALGKLDTQIIALKEAHFERKGASNLVQTLLKAPALGWLVGAAITAWAILTGKVNV